MTPDTFRRQQPLTDRLFRRERLLQLLQENGRRLVLVCGRPGQGKSVLVSDFLSTATCSKSWWNLVEQDADPRSFLRGLLGSAAGRKSESIGPDDEDLIISKVVQDLFSPCDGETYLVLNNFETVAGNPAILEIIQVLIPLIPKNGHLVLISDILLDFFFYKHRKDVLLLSDSMLAFDKEEIRRLVDDHYGLKLTEAEIARVLQITAGWVCAVIHLCETLAHLDGEQRRFLLDAFLQSSRLPDMDFVFRDKVLLPLAENEKQALFRASCLEPAGYAVLDALIGCQGRKTLSRLHKSGWFVSLPAREPKAFGIDPLFQEYLKEQLLQKHDGETQAYLRSVAEYYLRCGRALQSVRFFLACGQAEDAERAFLSQVDELIRDGAYQTIREHLRMFQEWSMTDSPRLEYCRVVVNSLGDPVVIRRKSHGLIAFFQSQRDYHRAAKLYSVMLVSAICFYESREKVSELLDESEKFLLQVKDSLKPPDARLFQSWVFLAKWWTVRSSREEMDLVLRAEEDSLRLRNDEVLLFAKMVMAQIHVDWGEFDQALQILQSNSRLLEKTTANRQYRPCYQLHIADTLYLTGKLDESLQIVASELERIEAGNPFTPYLYTNQLYCHLLKQELELAERTLDSFRDCYREAGTDFKDLIIYQGQMLLAYLRKDQRKAKYYSDRIQAEENRHLLILDFPWVKLNIGEVEIFLGEYKESEKLLDELIREAPEERFPYCAASAYALLSILHSRLNVEEQARSFAGEARRIIDEKAFRNLEICDPKLLQEFAGLCGDGALDRFHRLMGSEAAEQSVTRLPELQFLVMGGLRIFIEGKEIPNSEYNRKKRIVDFLKLLLVHRGKGINKEAFFEKFWPGYQADSCLAPG